MVPLCSMVFGVPTKLLGTESIGAPFNHHVVSHVVSPARSLQGSQTPSLSRLGSQDLAPKREIQEEAVSPFSDLAPEVPKDLCHHIMFS